MEDTDDIDGNKQKYGIEMELGKDGYESSRRQTKMEMNQVGEEQGCR